MNQLIIEKAFEISKNLILVGDLKKICLTRLHSKNLDNP